MLTVLSTKVTPSHSIKWEDRAYVAKVIRVLFFYAPSLPAVRPPRPTPPANPPALETL